MHFASFIKILEACNYCLFAYDNNIIKNPYDVDHKYFDLDELKDHLGKIIKTIINNNPKYNTLRNIEKILSMTFDPNLMAIIENELLMLIKNNDKFIFNPKLNDKYMKYKSIYNYFNEQNIINCDTLICNYIDSNDYDNIKKLITSKNKYDIIEMCFIKISISIHNNINSRMDIINKMIEYKDIIEDEKFLLLACKYLNDIYIEKLIKNKVVITNEHFNILFSMLQKNNTIYTQKINTIISSFIDYGYELSYENILTSIKHNIIIDKSLIGKFNIKLDDTYMEEYINSNLPITFINCDNITINNPKKILQLYIEKIGNILQITKSQNFLTSFVKKFDKNIIIDDEICILALKIKNEKILKYLTEHKNYNPSLLVRYHIKNICGK